LRVVPKDSIGAAFIYFTGSREHQLVLRREAIKNGWTLNEYGLFTNHAKEKSKRKFLAGKTEAEVYRALGLSFIPPELREVTGELEVAAKHRLPALVGFNDLLGDLQVQTDWTDGDSSIEQMALAARHNGLEYIAITDHTKGLAMVGGSNEARIRKQMKEIDRLNKKFRGKPLILKGAEVNILKNGELDIADEVLAELDVVGAAVHANFHQTQAEMTKRICKAISNRHVDILFHPTGRLINRRAPYEVDIDEVIRVAKKTGTVLEINGAPDRLDLKDVYIKTALASGIKFAIDSDAHDPSHFSFLRYGLGQARRGWARKSDIINTYPVKVMLSFLKDGKNKFSDKK